MRFETREHEANCFITLTYDEDHLPGDRGLDRRHFQQFIRSLRNRLNRARARKLGKLVKDLTPSERPTLRYFHCGEYGDLTKRPHYHAILFGQDFADDRTAFKVEEGHTLYTSPMLEELWDKGQHLIGDAGFDACNYVAGYITKKYTGNQSRYAYQRIDPETGEMWAVAPEYATMSLKPGIGAKAFEKYADEIYQHDSVVKDGREFPPPRYFDRLLSSTQPEVHDQVVAKRRERNPDPTTAEEHRERRRANRARKAITLARQQLKKGTL